MHPKVEQLPKPHPDCRTFLQAVRRQNPARVPLIELAVHPRVTGALLDDPGLDSADPQAVARATVRLLHRLGYDVVKVSAPIPFRLRRLTASGTEDGAGRQWQDQHEGPISDLAAAEAYPWPALRDVDFRPLEAAAAELPDGMGLIGFAGGVLEFSMDLIGMQRFMLATYDQPELIAFVTERVGTLLCRVFEHYCQMEAVCAVWLGDDLGGKNGLLLSPEFLRASILPWHRRLAEIAHDHDRPFLLHSCGKTDAIMPDLVEEVGIDAKHSFEDAILPVEAFAERWGQRVGVLGGVDVHLLATAGPEDIARRTRQILERLAPGGGYACGSGNSIPDYVPPENYLAMVETVLAFNAGA